MSNEELNGISRELKEKDPALYKRLCRDSNDYLIKSAVEDFLGRLPYEWDYETFRQFCIDN